MNDFTIHPDLVEEIINNFSYRFGKYKRYNNESYENYKNRRKKENNIRKGMLKGKKYDKLGNEYKYFSELNKRILNGEYK